MVMPLKYHSVFPKKFPDDTDEFRGEYIPMQQKSIDIYGMLPSMLGYSGGISQCVDAATNIWPTSATLVYSE